MATELTSEYHAPRPPAFNTVKPSLYTIFVNDLICGSFAGLAYILTAHPLDSIKVRMQLDRRPNINLQKIVREIYGREGFHGFYKGMGSPLTTIPLVNSIVFASYEFAKRMMGVQLGEECTFK
jgi:hypothetical protein